MRVTVGKGSCGIAAGASEIWERLRAGLRESGIDCAVAVTGYIGMCYLEPVVNIEDGAETLTFVKVDAGAADEILKRLRGEENDAARYAIRPEDVRLLHSQRRIALRNCGVIDPECIDEYIAREGYAAIETCVRSLTPEAVIEEIKTSGLSGRGGAGFPTWFKWDAARRSPGGPKYIICNADEGDPGAFMDRAVIEGDPHAVIEGMMIAAYAVGSGEGIVYVRAEYPLAIVRLEHALKQARERGLLGDSLFGSGFGFDIRIKAGAGAFVCGEETALIASLEGERGMPRLKPPFPPKRGIGESPATSIMWKPTPTCPGFCGTAARPLPRWGRSIPRAPRSSR